MKACNQTLRGRPALVLPAGLLALLMTACAAAPEAVQPIPEGDYRERIQVQEERGVRVSAAVPSASETQALFGKNLYKRGIQPVWLQIENGREQAIMFLPVGLDPQYFSPLEVANIDVGDASRSRSVLLKKFFDPNGILNTGFIDFGD